MGSSVVTYGVPITADRPLEIPRIDQQAVFGAVALEEVSSTETHEELQTRPVSSAHAEEMLIQTDGAFDKNLPSQRWSLHIGKEISFHWTQGRRILRYEIHDAASLEDFTYWAVHLVLPMFLALEGIVQIIHGGCVTHDEGAALFIAPSYGGKSTLVNTFLEQGHRLLSDDKVPLIQSMGDWQAVPSHPMHRPYRGRREMGRPAAAVASGPQRLTAIYALDIDEQASSTVISPLTGQAAMTELLRSHLFQTRFLRARGLEFLGELARSVPMYRVHTPRDLDRLPVLYGELLAHIDSLATPSSDDSGHSSGEIP